ncbi:MAG: hypothetical protein ABH840_00350 [Nanoarchaeota archaeon]
MSKRVLYVDRAPRDERELNMTHSVLLKLREKYDVKIQTDLDTDTIDLLAGEAKNNRAYDSLLTHVPFNRGSRASGDALVGLSEREFYEKIYSRSLSVLKKIKEDFSKMPILAYTGADNGAVMDRLLREVTDGVIFKSLECDIDAIKIGMALERLLA